MILWEMAEGESVQDALLNYPAAETNLKPSIEEFSLFVQYQWHHAPSRETTPFLTQAKVAHT